MTPLLHLGLETAKQKKGAPEMATPSLDFRKRAETGKTRFAQTVSRLFSARLRKFKAPSRAGKSKAKPTVNEGERQDSVGAWCVVRGAWCVVRGAERECECEAGGWQRAIGNTRRSSALAIDGVLYPCPRWRLEFLLQGGKREEAV
ncbi:hypothetical protein [Ralstonia sp. 24A2]|uniref:hypothetical protein n=1 Tax=Ralstonia sp. 24A2 TaxID=3447364 RepID=UPI003F6A48F1